MVQHLVFIQLIITDHRPMLAKNYAYIRLRDLKQHKNETKQRLGE